jgi:MFS family permease
MQEKKITNEGIEAQHREHAEEGSRETGLGQDGEGAPNVDTQHASKIEVSKLHGKWLTWMVSTSTPSREPDDVTGLTRKVTVVAGTGFTLLGFDQGVVSGLLTLPSFEAQFPETAGGFQGSKSATLQSFLVAICEFEVGWARHLRLIEKMNWDVWLERSATSTSVIDWDVSRLSSCKSSPLSGVGLVLIYSAGLIMIVGAILQAASINYAMILVARVVSGVGNGFLTSTIPAYQSECARPEKRGQLVLFEGSLITFVGRLVYGHG